MFKNEQSDYPSWGIVSAGLWLTHIYRVKYINPKLSQDRGYVDGRDIQKNVNVEFSVFTMEDKQHFLLDFTNKWMKL